MTQIMPHDSQGTRFLTPEIKAKFERGHPLYYEGDKCRWRGLKLAAFDKCYNSKTLQDHFVIVAVTVMLF